MKRRIRYLVIISLAVLSFFVLAGCKEKPVEAAVTDTAANEVEVKEPRNYFYVAAVHAHPYFLDTHLALKYTAEKLGVNITTMGPDDWNMPAMADALEQAIAKKPDGILTVMWDSSNVPAVKKAMAAGIPVVVLYATIPENYALGYIGLDNYQAGIDTGNELIKRGGTSGKFGIIMNAGASNTELKKEGALYALKDTDWELVVQAEDKADTETAIEAAKAMFNAHPDLDGVLGLDSSSGTGIGVAIEELGLEDKDMTIIVHDREDTTLEFIQKGYIDATVEAKTAFTAYLAIKMLEDYNDRRESGDDVPLSSDNTASGAVTFPQYTYVGSVIIDKDNVEYFMRENLPKY